MSDGYGRNYLLPRKLALVATDGAVDQAARCGALATCATPTTAMSATTIASALVPKVIEIAAKAGSEGRLFGSVTAADVADAVADQTGIELDRKQLEVDPIKTLGQHTATAQLHADVSFPITLDVVAAS